MRCAAWSAILVLIGAESFAQPRPGYDPSGTHIFPAGGRRGSTVAARVGTECAPPGTSFWISGDGVASSELLTELVPFQGEPSPRRAPTEIPATYPREWAAKIAVAPDAPVGVVHWRLSCGQGGTPSRPFVIGDLPEHIEQESNSTRELAEGISLPMTINGQIYGERDVDFFRFSVEKSSIVSCEVMARRLGSALDPVVSISTENGQQVPVSEGFVGNDPVLAFRADASVDYFVRVANVGSHGSPSCVYRLNVDSKPFLLSAFPAGGESGAATDVELCILGGNGTPGRLQATIPMPSDAGPFEYRHPDCLGTITLFADAHASNTEQGPNDQRDVAWAISTPSTVYGRFENSKDEDWFRIPVKEGASYTFTCEAIPRIGECLPTLALVDSKGDEIAKSRSVDAQDSVCRIIWTAPEAGDVFARARDLQFGASGGEALAYRFSVVPSKHDFEVRVASDNFNLMPGATGTVEFEVVRDGGFLGPIELHFSDLPRGMKAEDTKIAAKANRAKVKLTASDDVRAGSYSVQVRGRAKLNGQTVERPVMARHLGVDSEGVSVGPGRLDQWHLTVRHKPVFRLQCSEAYRYAHRGSVYPYPMEIERLDGFNGEIIVQQGDRQNRDMDGIEMLTTVVPRGDDEFMLPIFLPETMHINVQSQSQLYAQAYTTFTDKYGRKQSMLVLSEKRNMIRTLPPVVKLHTADAEVVGAPGDKFSVKLVVERTSNFPDAMHVELVSPNEGISADTVEIPAGATSAEIELEIADGVEDMDREVVFRATGQLFADTKVVSEASVRLQVRASSSSQ